MAQPCINTTASNISSLYSKNTMIGKIALKSVDIEKGFGEWGTPRFILNKPRISKKRRG